MRARVDDPRRMQSYYGPQKSAPQYQAESTDREQHESQNNRWSEMPLRQPDVKFVFGQIGDVALERCNVLAVGIAHQDPARIRPPLAIARRVRITVLVRELVMLTMRGHPYQRTSFHSRHAANRQKVLKPLGCRVGAMRQQAVITHAESEPAHHPVQEDRGEEPTPSEEEERCHGADVK